MIVTNLSPKIFLSVFLFFIAYYPPHHLQVIVSFQS